MVKQKPGAALYLRIVLAPWMLAESARALFLVQGPTQESIITTSENATEKKRESCYPFSCQQVWRERRDTDRKESLFRLSLFKRTPAAVAFAEYEFTYLTIKKLEFGPFLFSGAS